MVLCFAVELAAKRMGQVIHDSSAQQSATVIYMIYYAINHIFGGGPRKGGGVVGMIEKRVSDLEKAVGVADSDECTCPNVPGISGLRVTYGYQEPEATAEDLEWAASQSDRVEVCAVCARPRPTLWVLLTKHWRAKD